MADISVKPVRKGMDLSHPTAGALADAGGLWPEDQFTYRRLRDGDIKRIEVEAETAQADEPKAEAPAPSSKRS